jgi:hypothetical protein
MLNRNNRDEEAEAEAVEARRQGTELIDDHLSHHMDQNPDSSYVTWIACLHPENAEVTIDERFLVPGNPWWTVYEGAKGDIPTATAVPVQEEAAPSHSTALTVPDHNENNDPINTAPPKEEVSDQSSGLDLVVGCTLSFAAILTVLGLEAAAYATYWISAGFYRMAQAMDPPNAATGIFYSICLLVYWVLALVDSCLLLSSVLTTEIMAFALFIFSCLFAGCDMAARWHQYLRRTCHLLRWAFRSASLSAYPPRHLCLVCLPKDEKEDQDEEVGAIVEDKKWTQAAVPKENWIEEGSATPTAPPSTEHIIVLDESDVIVDDGIGCSAKKEGAW